MFLALALVLVFLPSETRERIGRGVRATLLRPILALQQGAVERRALFDDPERLRAERDSLAAFLVGQASLSAENRQLRELLGLGERLPPEFVPAEIVRIPGRSSEGYFELTAGAEQGVVPGASIVAAQGLVGQVRIVDGAVAFGFDWMHPDFRASAMSLDGEVYGIVEPSRSEGEPVLVLTGTPQHVQLEPGSLIVTSGQGGVFPRGIPIGMVIGPEGGENDWQGNYLIRPMVSPAEMNYVLVLGGPQHSFEGQDLALSWGIQPVAPIAPTPDPGFMPTTPGGMPDAGQGTQPQTTEPEGPRLLGEPVERPD